MKVSKDGQELASKLRRLRLEADLTTRQLSSLTGFSHTKLVELETGKTGIKPPDLETILLQLGTSDRTKSSLLADARQIRQSISKHRSIPT